MARTVRFHLDENCHGAIAGALRRRGIDVTTTPEAGLAGMSDDEQLAYSHGMGRVLFTQDRDLLTLHAAGVPHAGIAFCKKQSWTTGAIIQGLVLIWELFEPAEIRDRVEYL